MILVTLFVAIIGAHASDVLLEEELIFRSTSWHDLRLAYKAIDGQLDGVVAGAFTDKVAELFADQWAAIHEFARLSGTDPDFGHAVLAAINEAVTQDRAVIIRTNATYTCQPDRCICSGPGGCYVES